MSSNDCKNYDYPKYGHFDEQRGCFVLTAEPPRKWWNLHCNAIANDGSEMYAEVAHINDGPTRVRDADGTTVNLVGYDQKYHYIRNESTGTVFCAAGQPAPTEVQDLRIEFHREKTLMQCSCEGLKATQRVFVPQHLPLECTTITVTNDRAQPVTVSVFSYAMFQLTGTDSEGPGYGPDCAGIVQVKLTIAPGQTERADFILGQTGSTEEVLQLRSRLSPDALDAWCLAAEAVERERANTFTIDVGVPLYNGLFNIFLKSSCTIT